MFEFKITLNDDDYLRFNQYHILNSPLGKKTLMSYRFIIPIVCFMFVFILYIAGSDLDLVIIEAIVMTIFSIGWIITCKKALLKSMKKRMLKMKKEGRLPYNSEAILKFDDESIHEITPNSENKTNYTMIEKIAVAEMAIYIYFSSVQAYIIPVNAFFDYQERLNFLEFINSKVPTLTNTRQA